VIIYAYMENIRVIEVNSGRYYFASELQDVQPNIFMGCRYLKNIIDKAKLTNSDYCYAREKKGKWSVTNGSSARYDKLLLAIEWVENYEPVIEMAPEIILLDDSEKFIDDNNVVIEIEARGTRDCDNCFFLVNDVANGFGISALQNTIIDKNSSYNINEHYKWFGINTRNKVKNLIEVNKRMYLTYGGLLQVLYTSRTKSAKKFTTWATKILFTMQMGTIEQKKELASIELGIPIRYSNGTFGESFKSKSSIYLLTLGYAKDLRNTFKIDPKYHDKMVLGKFGYTNDLKRRIDEHNRDYGTMPNVFLRLLIYKYVDDDKLSNAEAELKRYMRESNRSFEYENRIELIIFDKSDLSGITSQYEYISISYQSKMSKVNEIIKDKDHEIALLKAEILLIKEQYINKAKDSEIALINAQHENKTKNLELLLQKELYEKKILSLIEKNDIPTYINNQHIGQSNDTVMNAELSKYSNTDNQDDNNDNEPNEETVEPSIKSDKEKGVRIRKKNNKPKICIERIKIEEIIDEFIEKMLIKTNDCRDFITTAQMAAKYNEFATSKGSIKVKPFHLKSKFDTRHFLYKKSRLANGYICVKFHP